MTLYRAVKHHPEELYRQFKYSLVARAEFMRKQKVRAETLTDIQRAARYLYLQKSAFGGKITGQSFGTTTVDKPRLNILNLESTLERAWQRLASVQIECKDFRDLIPRYDRAHTFFFLDPPYWKIPGYKTDFVEQDFWDLAEILASVKGKFLLTINDTAETRTIFSDFNIETVELKYSMHPSSKSKSQKRQELLISNYEADKNAVYQ